MCKADLNEGSGAPVARLGVTRQDRVWRCFLGLVYPHLQLANASSKETAAGRTTMNRTIQAEANSLRNLLHEGGALADMVVRFGESILILYPPDAGQDA